MTQFYFKNFPFIKYSFGDNEPEVYFQKLSAAIDLFDSLKQDVSFITKQEILDFERPDTLSYRLYKTTDYYWTFFLMNDQLRESGWPLHVDREQEYIEDRYDGWSFITNDPFAGLLTAGQEILTTPVGQYATIDKADPTLGQIIFSPTFEKLNDQNPDGPRLPVSKTGAGSPDGQFPSITGIQFTTGDVDYALSGAFGIGSTTKEYLGVHHWENSAGEYVDVDPLVQNTTGLTRITFKKHLQNKNQELREITVLRPGVINKVVGEFQKLIKS